MDALSLELTRRKFLATVTLPMILMSTVGNSLSYMVVRQSPQSGTSTAYYLRALAVTDTIAVHSMCWRYFLIGVGGVDIFTLSDAACKTQMFLNYWIADVAVWLVPCLATDRVLALYAPVRSRRLCTLRIALGVVAALLSLSLSKNVILLIGLKVNRGDSAGNLTLPATCWAAPEMSEAWQVRNAVAIATVACLPAGVAMAMNVMLFLGIRRRLRRDGSEQWEQLANSVRLALAISVAFLVFLLPYFLFLNLRKSLPNSSAGQAALHDLVLTVLEMFFYLNYTVNFLLYIVASPSYRRQVKLLLLNGSSTGTRIAPY